MPHTDGPAYYPHVCILSLNDPLIFNFWKSHEDYRLDYSVFLLYIRQKNYAARLYVEPRSMLIFKDQYYSEYLHGIEEDLEDVLEEEGDKRISNLEMIRMKELEVSYRTKTRSSLTIRYVKESK